MLRGLRRLQELIGIRTYTCILLLFIMLALFSIYMPLLVKPVEESASPFNKKLFGTSTLVSLLKKNGYRVHVANSVFELENIDVDNIVYVVIAPDKGFTLEEIDFLLDITRRKHVSFLIADEIGIVNNLTTRLFNIDILGELVRDRDLIGSGWDDFITCRCVIEDKSFTLMFSRSSVIKMVGRGKPLCRGVGSLWIDYDWDVLHELGEPMLYSPITGVYGYYSSGRFVVIADSSIFTNYMVNGYKGIPSTKPFVENLFRWLTRGYKDTVIVFDNAHYRPREDTGVKALVLLLSTPVIAFKILGYVLQNIGLDKLVYFAMTIALITGVIFYKPLKPSYRKRPSLVDEARFRLASEVARLGRILGDEYLLKLASKLWKTRRAVNRLAKYISRLEEDRG